MKITPKIIVIISILSTTAHGMLETVTKLTKDKTEFIVFGCKNHKANSRIQDPTRDLTYIKSLMAAFSFKPLPTAIVSPLPQSGPIIHTISSCPSTNICTESVYCLLTSLKDYITDQPTSINYASFIPLGFKIYALEDLHSALNFLIMSLVKGSEDNLLSQVEKTLRYYKQSITKITSYKMYQEELTAICEDLYTQLARYREQSPNYTIILDSINNFFDAINDLEQFLPRTIKDPNDIFGQACSEYNVDLTSLFSDTLNVEDQEEKNFSSITAIKELARAIIQQNRIITKDQLIDQLKNVRLKILTLTNTIIIAYNNVMRLCQLHELTKSFNRIVLFVNSTDKSTLLKELQKDLGSTIVYYSYSSKAKENDGNSYIIEGNRLTILAKDLLNHSVNNSAHCLTCNKTPAASICSACKLIYYCSQQCQKAHWKEHKPKCEEIRAGHKNEAQAFRVIEQWRKN